MLIYTQRPEQRSRKSLLRDSLICFETAVCRTELPAEISSGHLYANEIMELSLITGGSGICQALGQSIPCKKGDVFVVPADIPHNCFVTGSGEKLVIRRICFDARDWFDGETADPASREYCFGVFRGGQVVSFATLNAGTCEKIAAYLEEIRLEAENKEPGWTDAIRSALIIMFISLSRYIGKAEISPGAASNEWNDAGFAVRLITENFADSELTLEKIAGSLHVSKSSLSRLFAAYTGERFSVYLRKVRMDHACRLLTETDLTVKHIAYGCGIRDVQSFYKNFKSLYGITPNKYRAAKKAEQLKGGKIMAMLSEISEKMQQGRAKIVVQLVQEALDEGCDPERILSEGLIFGMNVVGEKFRNNEIFVPEVLVAARAMNMGAQVLKPYLAAKGVKASGRVCIGTVQGDLHDIGKNLVKMMMEGKGLEVIDLGTDVSPETFVRAAIEQDCRVICCSALLTTTMQVMEEVVKEAIKAGIRDKVKIMIGGAPVSQEFCDRIGADIYTPDAASAADAAAAVCAGERM